jgi:hypothetical protein
MVPKSEPASNNEYPKIWVALELGYGQRLDEFGEAG